MYVNDLHADAFILERTGSFNGLLEKYGLGTSHIVEAVQRVIARK